MPDYIDGIYNYCDRWCERCPLTARCRSFAMEQSLRRRSDDENASFWAAFEEGHDLEDETGFEDEADAFADAEPGEDVIAEGDIAEDRAEFGGGDESDPLDRAMRDPLSAAAMDYALDLRKWLARNEPPLPPDERGNRPATLRDDAFDILGWYGFQIGAKLARAMSGQIELDDEFESAGEEISGEEEPGGWDDADWDSDEEESENLSEVVREAQRTDRDGSAKVALIGIERSLGALTVLRRELPGEDEALRGFFRRLSQLRVEIDRRWPHARTFRRPGFDE